MKMIRRCPACETGTRVTELTCTGCGMRLAGDFDADPFAGLDDEELDFALVFIKNRGNIKEVEKELNISYPTVRTRLDSLIRALGFSIQEPKGSGDSPKMEIISRMEKGDLSPSQAAKLLKNI